MAFSIGTATDSIDLWNKLLAFLTTNPELVANGEQWQQTASYTLSGQPRVVLRGPGASGSDAIYVGLARTDTPDTDTKNIRIVGMTGFLPDALAFNEHVNVSPEVRIWLDGGAMKYWFVANGRRFAVVIGISTVYQAAYAGFFLPYANPLSYPYPMMVGGSSNAWTGSGAVTSWRSQSALHVHFPLGVRNSNSGVTMPFSSNAFFLDPGGAWVAAASDGGLQATIAPFWFDDVDANGTDNWGLENEQWSNNTQLGSLSLRNRLTQNYGGGFSLEPFSFVRSTPEVSTIGVMDGIYFAPGTGQAVENTVLIDGVNYLIVQNVFRTTRLSYWALRLE